MRRAVSKWSVMAAGALVLALAGSAIGQNTTLELKNGDRITGRILSETTNGLTLSNAWSREIAIPLTEISRRTPVSGSAALAATRSTATNAPTVVTNAVALAKAVPATNTFFTQPFLKHWHGDVQAGIDLTFSERNRQVYNAKAKLTYAHQRLKNVLDYNMTYGRSEIIDDTTGDADYETDANRMEGAMKTDFDLTRKWYVYNLGGAGYDEIRKIDLRYEIGPGLGYHLIQWTNFFVNVESGSNYQNEQRADGSRQSTFFYRLAENAAWKITPRLTWDEKFEYLPQYDDLGEYRMRFETNLRYAMLQNVFLNLSIIDIYDSMPASGVTKNDLQIRSSVGVKF